MDAFMSAIICFLSVYGVFHLLYALVNKFDTKIDVKHKYQYTVIGIDETADNIEEYVRGLARNDEKNDLILINHSNDGEHGQLLSILESEFDFVKVFTADEYKDYILRMEE